jgi:hypothetical protein
MKNKNFRKLKYVSGNPQNYSAGFCTIYPTASGGLGGPQPNFFSLASLAVLHLFLKVLKALTYNITHKYKVINTYYCIRKI